MQLSTTELTRLSSHLNSLEVDGEDMEALLAETHLTLQIFRQLYMKASSEYIRQLEEEKRELFNSWKKRKEMYAPKH